MHALEISHVTKRYGSLVAVDDLSLTVLRGEFFGFLGPNGAGKTTTISAVTGVGTYDEGTIEVFGIDVKKNYREARKKVGLAPQEFTVDIFQKVEHILWYMAGYYGMTKPDREKRITEMFNIFELEPHKNKPFMALSGGLKRRVMLARAMVHDPELLILDEPTAGVDVELRIDLWKYLRRINEEGKTIVLTSHYLEEVEQLCGRIAIINDGKLVAVGEKGEFTKNGASLEKRYLEMTKKVPRA